MKRLLNLELAADYCDVSPGVFLRHVPVKPIKLGRSLRWDIVALDRWIEGTPTNEPIGPQKIDLKKLLDGNQAV